MKENVGIFYVQHAKNPYEIVKKMFEIKKKLIIFYQTLKNCVVISVLGPGHFGSGNILEVSNN